MKSISKILILIIVSKMLLTSCEIDDKKEENKATAPATANPTKNPSVIIQPTEKPTIKPTSTSKPTVAPTNKPTETAKTTTPVPTTTSTPTPTLAPSVDYSKWGKHGFERLLPIPMPFSDEEADWISRQQNPISYRLTNNKKIVLKNPDEFIKIFKDYVQSFEDYGYVVTLEQYSFTAQLRREQILQFNCNDGYISILIGYRT